jgi:hypothetical protein
MGVTGRLRDVTGKRIRVGDMVRVVGVPELAGMAAAQRRESLPVFRHLVGTYRRVADLEDGFVGIWFRIRRGPNAGLHWVALEPWLVRIRRRIPA